MRGVDSSTGKALSGVDHLRQSIRDILTTPLGSRVMRRDYGSRLFSLVDAPQNEETKVEMFAATVEALNTWEPRILVQQVQVDSVEPGRFLLSITAKYLPEGKNLTLEGITIS